MTLAFARKEPGVFGLPSRSADGRYLAYVVRTPPAAAELHRSFQASGTPNTMVGAKVWVKDLREGTSRMVGPAEGNSYKPTWSPDSGRLAFISDADGRPRLWVFDPATGTSSRLSDAVIKAKIWSGDEPCWSPDSRRLFVHLVPENQAPTLPREPSEATSPPRPSPMVLRSGREEKATPATPETPAPSAENHYLRVNNAALAAVDADSGQVQIIVPAETLPRPSMLRVSATGKWLSYLSVFKDDPTGEGFRVDLATASTAGGKVRTVAPDLAFTIQSMFDRNYRWHPQRDLLVYLRERKLWKLDWEHGQAEPVRIENSNGLGPMADHPLCFDRSGSALLVGVDPMDPQDYTGEKPGRLAWIPLDGGTPVMLAWEEHLEFLDLVRTDSRVAWQPEPGTVTLLLQDRRTAETLVTRMDLSGGSTRVLWRGWARFRGFDGGGRHQGIIASFEDVATPPDWFRFSPDFSQRERLTTIEPRFDQIRAAAAHVFPCRVPTYDGGLKTIRSLVLLPDGAKQGDRLPCVVIIYGGADLTRSVDRYGGGEGASFANWVFTSRGYAVLLANLPLSPEGRAGNPAQEHVDALLPQLYTAANLGYIDPARLVMLGQSYGGYGVGAIASRTNLFRGAIAVSGLFDLGGSYGQDMGQPWFEQGQGRMGDHPWANVRRYIDNSPYYQADKVQTPLLLIHGDQDPAVEDAKRFFHALQRLKKTAQLAVYPGEGHGLGTWTRAHAVDACKRMLDFLDGYLPPL